MGLEQPARSGSPGSRSPATIWPASDDTLWLYFLCAHPSLTPSSAIALTLRAVAGLTTRQIADAYLVPEATMAQRISRAKQRIAGVRLDQPGDVTTVLRVLYLLFNEGYSGDIDMAAEAIRVTRQLAALRDEPEVQGCSLSCCCITPAATARITPSGTALSARRARPNPVGRRDDRRGHRHSAGRSGS